MTPESFLLYRTLRETPTGTGIEPWLIELEERGRFSENFYAFPEEKREKLDALVSHITALLVAAKEANTDNYHPIEPVNFRKHLRKTKLYEVAGLLQASGILEDSTDANSEDDNEINLYDLCSGAGSLGTITARLRANTGKATRLTCIDKSEISQRKHEAFAKTFAPGQKTQYIVQDVRDAHIDPSKNPTYLLAKHACGQATDRIVDLVLRVLEKREGVIKAHILSCCHGVIGPLPQGAAAMGLTQNDWQRLGKAADWVQRDKGSYAEIGRVAMRIMDGMRIAHISDNIQKRVIEVCPSSLSDKNHALSVEHI